MPLLLKISLFAACRVIFPPGVMLNEFTLHTQTTIFMICMVYLVLHAVIWFGLYEHHNNQVQLWCISGILSGVSVVFLATRTILPDFVFYYVAQFLMVVGNLGRILALRMYRSAPLRPHVRAHVAVNTIYFLLFSLLAFNDEPDRPLLLLFFGFYTVVCFDYFLVGRELYRENATFGPKLIMLAGLVFTSSLGIKTVCLWLGVGAETIYGPGFDQNIMIIGQFLAISLSNIGFLRIFLERAERQKLEIERTLAASAERIGLLAEHRNALQVLLAEREEILRQLTLSNKSAGMGALVASLAHELKQPLCAIGLNAQLAGRQLDASMRDPAMAKSLIACVIEDNQRAVDIIGKLRNMFGASGAQFALLDMNALIRDTLGIVAPQAKSAHIGIECDFASDSSVYGDKTQLQQVVLNLLNNACEAFSGAVPASRRITLTTRVENSWLIITVADNGSGIAPDKQLDVFNLFKTSKASGMGVGLWLSKAVVTAHNGSIDFCSTYGIGSHFDVRLPLAQLGLREPAPALDFDLGGIAT